MKIRDSWQGRNSLLSLVLSLVFFASSLIGLGSQAQAIEGGFTKPEFMQAVVPFLKTQTEKLPYCSGALISEYIIATAAHCVADGGGNALKEIWVAPAGSDLSKSPEKYRVTGVFIPANYKDSSSTRVTDNDIAFVTVKNSLGKTPFARITSLGEARSFYGQSVYVAGYGRNRPSGPTSATPLFLLQRIIDWTLPEFTYGNYSHIVATDTESPCPGDSGGPMFKETPTGLAILGVMAGTNGCTSTTAREERLVGFLISGFNATHQLAKDAIAAAPKSPEGLKVETAGDKVTVSWLDVADTLLRSTVRYSITDSSGKSLCEAIFLGIFNNAKNCTFTVTSSTSDSAVLTPVGISKNGAAITLDIRSAVSYAKGQVANQERARADAEAKAKAEADAKAKAEADAKAKAEVDARAKAEAESKARIEAEVKAKADADARAKAEAEASAKAAAEVTKEKTITCKKGKLTKKVTAVKPKCPKGYKKK